jgi:hypothetical protein
MDTQDSAPKGKSFNPIVIVGVFAVLLVLILIVLGSGKSKAPITQTPPAEEKKAVVTKENVALKTVDLNAAKTEAAKLPVGFPSLIPVETKDIFVSDSKVYSDRSTPVTVYTINYRSAKTVTEKYNEYLDYMTKGGYVFAAEGGKDVKNHSLYGTKDGNSLLVSASTQNGQTVVQLSYTLVK